MKVLVCGDIVGRSGREIVEDKIPELRKKENLDFVIVNGENAAGGFGITEKICKNLYKHGVDVITSGNHIWDQQEILSFIDKDLRLLRPDNLPKKCPGRGSGLYKIQDGTEILVINIMCRVFMDAINDPFETLDDIIKKTTYKSTKPIILVDVHGEATSEKMCIGHFLDGRVTAVFGTHTHVPTSDLHLLEKGTLYISDLGMCGDYNSVLGMKKENAIARFLNKHKKTKLETADGKATLCGIIFEVDKKTKIVKDFKQIKIEGILGD